VRASLAAVLAATVSCGESKETRQGTSASQPVISWEKAAPHVGQNVVLEGPVVSAHFARTSKGQPTFLNLGKPHPDPGRFTVVIWGSSRGRFSGAPEDLYRGKLIRVSGTITTYRGAPQIIADGPEDIEIVR